MMAKFVWLKADADFSYFYSDLGTPGGEYVLLSEASERIKVLEDALERLSRPLACGCKPCTGDCRSKTALEAELEGRIDFARAALEVK